MTKRKRRKSTLRKNTLRRKKTMRRKNISRRKNNIRIKKTVRRKTNIRKKNTMRKNKNMIMIGGTPLIEGTQQTQSLYVDFDDKESVRKLSLLDLKNLRMMVETGINSDEGRKTIHYYKVYVELSDRRFHIYRRYNQFKYLNEQLSKEGFLKPLVMTSLLEGLMAGLSADRRRAVSDVPPALPGKFSNKGRLEKLNTYIDGLLIKLKSDRDTLVFITPTGKQAEVERWIAGVGPPINGLSQDLKDEIDKLKKCLTYIKSFICD